VLSSRLRRWKQRRLNCIHAGIALLSYVSFFFFYSQIHGRLCALRFLLLEIGARGQSIGCIHSRMRPASQLAQRSRVFFGILGATRKGNLGWLVGLGWSILNEWVSPLVVLCFTDHVNGQNAPHAEVAAFIPTYGALLKSDCPFPRSSKLTSLTHSLSSLSPKLWWINADNRIGIWRNSKPSERVVFSISSTPVHFMACGGD